MREKKDESHLPLPVYESHPPTWLPKVHGTADLGYVGFHPPRPGQDEDVLTENNIKNGFLLGQPVSVETFSAQGMINEKLHSPDTLSKLEMLMNEVVIVRADRVPSIPPSSFRMPTRVTLNDAKRQAWFADLANPDVPLHKLGKSVPHGAKGQDLLDLLHSNNVAISRAVWFLRVFGANETTGLRNKPTYVPTQYSIDWANVVTGYMKKQLLEIALPSAPRPGLNIKQTFKGVLADVETKEKWMSRFTYCLQLLRTFYAEDLVDRRTFLTWLVQQMTSCNLAQAGFLTRLCDEYLDDIVASRALSRSLVEACLTKLHEIQTTTARDFLPDTEYLLRLLVQRLCLALPDSFVNPKMWMTYSTLLEAVVIERNDIQTFNDRSVEQTVRDMRYLLSENFADIKRRNEAMLFRGPLAQASLRLGMAVSNVKLLNSISSNTDMSQMNYFSQDVNDIAHFKDKLDLLLTWSVTPLQYGDHRPFAAVTLIRIWREKACDRANRRDAVTPNEFLQDQLFDWLDASEVAGDSGNVRDISLLYGKLVKHEIFSYSNYIQRLIARGERGLSYLETTGSRHRLFLSWIPLFNSTSSLSNQRKVTLHGARARDIPEDIVERDIRKEIRTLLPDLFEGTSQYTSPLTTALLSHCQILMSATRFEQVRTFRQWLLPVFKKHIIKGDIDHNILFKCYLVTIELMDFTKCYHSVLDLTFCMLEHSEDIDSMNGLIGTLYRYATIWTCMDVMPVIVKALDKAHQVWKTRGIQSRPLLASLMKFDDGKYLNDHSRERTLSDIAAFTLALQPIVDHPETVPEVLPEILLLAGDPEPNAPSILVNSLWIKYRTSLDWAWKVWDNTVASLRQIPSMTADTEGRRACALRYGSFLWHVDQHLPSGLDDDVLQWFLGPGRSEVAALSQDAWDVLKVVLLYLAVHGALKTTTILQGLVYPAWHLGATSRQLATAEEIYLASANKLCFHLLLQEDGSGDSMPPADLFEMQCIRTRRQSVYDEPHFPLLVSSIPALVALENNEAISELLCTESTSLRCQLCQSSEFRQGAYRNLDIIRDAFESSSYLVGIESNSESLSKRAIAGLKMILCDSSDDANLYDWPEVTCLLSPWKIAATTIQMQLQVKQLSRALNQDSTAAVATENLNKLTSILFHHTKTAEEAYYVGEMARGADITIASKFINNGFTCMTELLDISGGGSDSSRHDCFLRVGELLRVLIHVSQPFRDTIGSLPIIGSSVQETFIETLEGRMKQLEPHITIDNPSLHSTNDLIVLLRLLQFILSFRTNWTAKSKDLCANLAATTFRIALHCSGKDSLNINVYPVLIDTLLLILDEIPHDPKVISFDPYRHYPDLPLANLPSDLPPEYQKQIASLLAQPQFESVVSNLVSIQRDTHGNATYGSSIMNRPWEWIENLGEPSTLDHKDEEKEKEEKERHKLKSMIKNSGSISLDHFGTRLTEDGINCPTDEADPRIEGSIRSFQDDLSEPLFARDWRETRLDFEPEPSPDTVLRLRSDQDPEALATDGMNLSQPLRRSPAASSTSRTSTRASLTSRKQSPGNKPTNSTTHEIIDVDSIPTASSSRKETGSKRKAPAISDDEIEILEGPVASRAVASAKKQKTTRAPAGKTRARKK